MQEEKKKREEALKLNSQAKKLKLNSQAKKLKLNSQAKKLSQDLKKVSKNLKKVSKDLNKEAFFTVSEAIMESVEAPISRLFEVFDELEAPALNPSFVPTDSEVKGVRSNSAIELVKKVVKPKNGKSKKEKQEEKKNEKKRSNKLIKDLKSLSTFTELVPSVLVHHEVHVLEFSEYYNSSFLLAMEDLENVHLGEAKAEESRLGNKNSNKFDDFFELDAILNNFDAPQWVDLSNLDGESAHFDDDLGFFC